MFGNRHCSLLKAAGLVLLVNPYLMCCSSCGLQVEQEATNNRHQSEVFELKHQISRLNNLVERGNQALQQKAQVRNTVHLLGVDFTSDCEQNSEWILKTDGNYLVLS